jgi:methylase of polypeptide subunit release factors
MPDVASIYRFIEQEALPFTHKIEAAAHDSRNEAEFRTRVTQYIEEIAAKLDVDLLLREEYTLATGRADAVYNRLIIEYEPPGSLRENLSHRHTQHAVEQLRGYIEGVAKREKHAKDRLLGVAFDGHYYVFVRYREGHWYVEPPLKVTPQSTARFLRSLFSLSSGRALIPENLVDDFGAQNVYSQRVARALYHALKGHRDDLVGKLFQQWQLFFSEVSGYEEATAHLRDKKELRAFARGMGLKPEEIDPPRLFFVIHTYFSFLVKAIARLVLEQHAAGKLGTTPLTVLANADDETLRRELEQMEKRGGIFRTLGLQNLLEGDFFSWYLYAWSPEVADALRLTLGRLAEYNPATLEEDPYAARDLLKKLYHYLLPRELRHDLGEYYTPDWLAERVLTQLGEPLFQMPGTKPLRRFEPKRLLDPACGSGTFLILGIRALKEHCLRQGLGEAETLQLITRSIVGIDLNPLAVLAARVNYLLAIADLVPYRRGPIEIPVYLADSILPPEMGEDLYDQHRRRFKTVVGDLCLPTAVDTREEMEKLTGLLEEHVCSSFSTEAFLARAGEIVEPMDPSAERVLRELYEKLLELESQGLDGIWARVMKNAFMPLFLEKFDYIAGNPPWVNWESLPDGYRADTAYLWQRYGLFVHGGMDTILGKGKKDIATLMTYAVVDRFLNDGGKLAFVITQSVFKTAGAGQGFRRFRIGKQGPHLRVLHVDDLSELQPFEGASNRTAVVVLQKGQPTRYPVPYTYWKKAARGRLDYESTLEEVFEKTKRLEFHAVPVNADDPTSAWLTARRKALNAIRKILGPSDYKAHEGVNTGGANGVYWLEIVAERPDGLLVVRNLTEGAKRKVEQITTEIEPDLIYPLLRGRDVHRWHASPSAHILMVQDPEKRRGIAEAELQHRWPKTWVYLKRFEKVLRQRAALKRYFTRKDKSGRVVETGPFYSMFDVGDYTFAAWKVVWARVGNKIEASVTQREVLPQETITLLPADVEEEALYICSVVNSIPFQFAAFAYSQAGGKSFGSPHLLENIRIPKFDAAHVTHSRLCRFSKRAHELAPAAYAGDEGAQQELQRVEAEIDEAAAELWGLTAEELAEIRKSLEELRG